MSTSTQTLYPRLRQRFARVTVIWITIITYTVDQTHTKIFLSGMPLEVVYRALIISLP